MTDASVSALGQRVVIIGNSGAGKSLLAERLANAAGSAHVVLDRIHWDSTTFATKRDENVSKRLTLEASLGDEWIIEGVYGFLAEVALQRATGLVWLNLPWKDCEAGIVQRGAWRDAEPGALASLLTWASEYYTRRTSSSLAGHQALFAGFGGVKYEITSRAAADALIAANV